MHLSMDIYSVYGVCQPGFLKKLPYCSGKDEVDFFFCCNRKDVKICIINTVNEEKSSLKDIKTLITNNKVNHIL